MFHFLKSTTPVRYHWRGALGVMALALAIVAALFSGPLHHPGRYLFNDESDALKNYFVLAYYVQYDHGTQFTGMNYPRGEHLNYADLQPLLAMPLAWAHRAGLPVTGETGIAATNLLLLLALVAAAGLLYAILRRLLLPGWYAALAALLITFLSPQLLRFQAHMSLGYACMVPAQWYLLLRALAARRAWPWWAALGAFNVLAGLLATYYLGIGSLLLLAYGLVLGLQRGWRQQARPLVALALTAVLPLLAFRAWLLLTDPITDRPPNPYGLLVYHANFTSVFAPADAPLKAVWQVAFHTEEPIFEGIAYVGVTGLLVLLASLVLAGRYLWRRRWQRLGRPLLPRALQATLWATTLLLLLAMALPMRLPGLGWTVSLLGPLRQFRSLGRFAWPFYYVFSAYAAFYLYRLWRYLRQHRAAGFAATWLPPLLLLWGAEAWWRTYPVAEAVAGRDNSAMLVGADNDYLQLLGWNAPPSYYQALLPLPFFAIGTDKLGIESSLETTREAYRAAYSLHLPLLSLYLGRASVGETLRMAQLFSSSIIPRELPARLPSTRPILLLVTPHPLSPAEQRLVVQAHRVAGNARVTLYELPVSALAANTQAAERQRGLSLLPGLIMRNGLATTTNLGVYYLPFDQQPDRRGHLASGAFHELKEGFSTLYNGPPPTPVDTGRYEASVWVSARTDYGLGDLQVKVYAQGQQLEHVATDARRSTEIDGDWVRVSTEFRLPPSADHLEVLYESRDLLADDLLIRPLTTHVYWHTVGGVLVRDGYRLGR